MEYCWIADFDVIYVLLASWGCPRQCLEMPDRCVFVVNAGALDLLSKSRMSFVGRTPAVQHVERHMLKDNLFVKPSKKTMVSVSQPASQLVGLSDEGGASCIFCKEDENKT